MLTENSFLYCKFLNFYYANGKNSTIMIRIKKNDTYIRRDGKWKNLYISESC